MIKLKFLGFWGFVQGCVSIIMIYAAVLTAVVIKKVHSLVLFVEK